MFECNIYGLNILFPKDIVRWMIWLTIKFKSAHKYLSLFTFIYWDVAMICES